MQRLKELREKFGLTQKQLGHILGFAESTISLYESGGRRPDGDKLVRLASYFHVTVDYLLGCEEVSNEAQSSEIKENQPTAEGSELDPELISLMEDLPQEDFQRVKDFVAGLKAARKEPPSPPS